MEELLFAVPFSFWDHCFSWLSGVRFERLFCADASVSSYVFVSHVWRGCGRFRMACGQTGPSAGRAVVNGALRSPPCGLPSLLRGFGGTFVRDMVSLTHAHAGQGLDPRRLLVRRSGLCPTLPPGRHFGQLHSHAGLVGFGGTMFFFRPSLYFLQPNSQG